MGAEAPEGFAREHASLLVGVDDGLLYTGLYELNMLVERVSFPRLQQLIEEFDAAAANFFGARADAARYQRYETSRMGVFDDEAHGDGATGGHHFGAVLD